MRDFGFSDGNISDLLARRTINPGQGVTHELQIPSSLLQRLSLEQELEGHQGCVNALSWNSNGSLLISGSDDTRVNIWSYPSKGLVHSIETGHSANIFCTKFVPETSDELVVSGAGDAEVRLFRVSRLSGTIPDTSASEPSALFRCHSRRVKKLAVEGGNPNVVWSASEDGTLRQHDFREGVSCPPAGSSHQECRNILLDLRSGEKRSLADNPRHCLGLKSCDISPTRPHQILIGGSDAFGRLYDRRMLPPLSSSEKRMKPPPCVNYFCPIHLSDHGRPSLHLTHVTFNPNGEEILLSYSGEHVYLMDVNPGGDCNMRYRAYDVSKQMLLDPVHSGEEMCPPPARVMPCKTSKSWIDPVRARKCNQLLQYANKCLDEESDFLHAIEACSEVLDERGPNVGDTLRRDCFCTRAALLLKRQWKNDSYMAIRDCKNARGINPSSFKAHYHMAEALMQLGRHKEALDFAIYAQDLSPSNSKASDLILILREHISAAEAEKSNKESEKLKPEETRVRSLSDLICRAGVDNSDASQDAASFERDDSDYDDEMELDFETSISGAESRDIESGILRGSLNLRFHRKGDSAKSSCSANGSCCSPSSSQSGRRFTPEVAIDMKRRYVGHCNVGTDIKQASFLGQKGEYIASGSDDGRWFIWEKRTGRLIKMLAGDENVVNCVQCHPFDCAIATSGIDNTIKLWTPRAQMPSMVAGGAAGPETDDVLSVMENNQQKMCRSREPISPFEILQRFRMHDFTEGTIHPFECTQS